MRYFAAILFLLGVLLSSCGESYKTVGRQISVPEKGKLHDDSLLFDSIGKFYFSRLVSPGVFGVYNTFHIPEENIKKELWVVFEGRARSNYPYSNGTITVVGSNEKNETLCWKARFLKSHLIDVNTWSHFKDSIFLPAQLDFKTYNVINTFVLLGPSAGEKFDVDSLVVTVRQKVSYI
ncbi:MAG: hypothetical protein K0S32_2775 [Bacteroidetes bacterium]|jgi:hypothetical protein|nr:hypothetical protein [Bacteroidota bacterium]